MNQFDFWASTESDDEFGDMISRKNPRKGMPAELRARIMGRSICFGGKGGGSAPAADPRIGQAAMENVELGRDWLEFADKSYKEGLLRQDDMDALTKKVVEQQMATQDKTNAWAAEDRDRTKTTFQPLQDEFIETAKNYDSPEKQAEAAAAARSDIARTGEAQRQATQRSMASMGIDPNSGRFQAVDRGGAIIEGLASAGAENAARTMVKDRAISMKADAINMGNGLASSTAAAYGLGLNAGNSAVANQGAANANFYANNSQMTQGYGGAMQGNSTAGGILNAQYSTNAGISANQNNAAASASAGTGAMVGSVVGGLAIAF